MAAAVTISTGLASWRPDRRKGHAAAAPIGHALGGTASFARSSTGSVHGILGLKDGICAPMEVCVRATVWAALRAERRLIIFPAVLGRAVGSEKVGRTFRGRAGGWASPKILVPLSPVAEARRVFSIAIAAIRGCESRAVITEGNNVRVILSLGVGQGNG